MMTFNVGHSRLRGALELRSLGSNVYGPPRKFLHHKDWCRPKKYDQRERGKSIKGRKKTLVF